MFYSPADYSAIFRSKKGRKWKRATIAAMWESESKRVVSKKGIRKTRKPRNSHRNRGYAVNEMNSLKTEHPSLFERMFRMDVASFDELVDLLDPFLKKNEKYAILSSGSPISTTTRLAVTLRWLSGGSYIDLCFAWGISKAIFYSDRGVLWPTINALDDLMDLGLPLDNPSVLAE